jgi:hypothetical protein
MVFDEGAATEGAVHKASNPTTREEEKILSIVNERHFDISKPKRSTTRISQATERAGTIPPSVRHQTPKTLRR